MSVNSQISVDPFGGLLRSDFVARSIPSNSRIHLDIERLKGAAGSLALAIFDAGKKDVAVGEGITFAKAFSQEAYGAGFTKGLSGILAYLICLEEIGHVSEGPVNEFSFYVRDTADKIYKRILSGDRKLADVRKLSEEIDNFGGYYQTTPLTESIVKELTPNGVLRSPLEIDPASGHLIAKVSNELPQRLLNAYRAEIESYLSEEGKKNLKLPCNIGHVVVAYRDELANIPQDKLNEILSSVFTVELAFKKPYIVPVRGDNRYSLVASIYMESNVILSIRSALGLKQLYSEGRPLRYTFGAVHTIPVDNDSLIERMRRCSALKPWLQLAVGQV